MNTLIFLSPLLCPLPLAAALLNRMAAWAVTVMGAAVLAGCLLLVDDGSQKISLGIQIVLLGFCSYLADTFLRKKYLGVNNEIETGEIQLQNLRDRHKRVKQDVLRMEKEENQSLQIYAVAKSLAEALSWKDMAPRLTSGIQKLFGAFEFLLYSINEEDHWILLHRRGGWAQEFPIRGAVPKECRVYQPVESSEVVPVLYVPIYSMLPEEGLQMNGAIFMKSPIGPKSEEELKKIGKEFGEQLGMTLNKAILFSQMEIHSQIDGLTGLLRRQAFMERMNEELKKSRVFHSTLSVMMVDVDHFKAVNDNHGHAAGDLVLKKVAETLKEAIYETDVVGRYGGEEFVMVFPKAEREGVLRKAESIRKKMENELITFGFEKLKVTISIGVSHYPVHGQTAEALIGRADQALYQAKENGRNIVIEAQ